MKTLPSIRMAMFAAGVLMLGSVAGCVQTSYVAMSPTSYGAKPEGCELQIFNTMLPDREYEEVGIIEGKGNLWKSELADILPEIRKRACEVGGDALILGDSDSYAQGEEGISVQKTSVTVIRWK